VVDAVDGTIVRGPAVAGRSQFFDAAGRHLSERHVDRAYLFLALVREREPDLGICGKAWPVRNASGRFAKGQFTLDLAAGRGTYPAAMSMPF